jgi:hypothetical protein
MRFVRHLTVLLTVCSLIAYAEGNRWNRVRYNGGTLETKVDPKDWDNQLTVTPDMITFKLKDGQTVNIPTNSVTGLSYGQEAHRRVGTMIALGILVAPLALFGLFHKTRLHFIGMEYTTSEGKKSGLLLQGDKDNYRAILMALKSTTRAPLAVAEEDRKYVPTGISANVAHESGEANPASSTNQGPQTSPKRAAEKSAPESPLSAGASVSIASSPDSADISVDGSFVGSTPAALNLSPGKHVVKVTSQGYTPWQRDIQALSGSHVSLNATLDKLPSAPVNQTTPPVATVESTNVALGLISVTSDPNGAEIFVDSALGGHTPATLKLKSGKHSVQVVMRGYKDFVKEVSVNPGTETAINVTLTK